MTLRLDFTAPVSAGPVASSFINSVLDKSITSINETDLVGLTNILDHTFRECAGLVSVALSSNITCVYTNVFWGCTSLVSASLPAVETIGGMSFGNCSSLVSVSIPVVSTIGAYAFQSNWSLTSINLPSSISTNGMGTDVFSYCDALTSITINKPNGSVNGAPWGATNATVTWTG